MRQFLAQQVRSFGSTACVLVGLLLLTASLLKLRSLVIVLVAPGQGSGEMAFTMLSVLLVALEFTLGALLVLALASRRIVDICLGMFSLFACYNLWVTLEGRSGCDCFGVVPLTLGPRETRAIPAVYKLPAGTGWFEVPFVVYHDVDQVAPLQGRIVVHVR